MHIPFSKPARLMLALTLAAGSACTMFSPAHADTLDMKARTPAASGPHQAGKANGSGVTVTSAAAGTATIGQAVEVPITFSDVKAGGASASFSADPSLALANADPVALAPGRQTITVRVTPSADGLYFINVFTRQGRGASALSIPVQVGQGGAKLKSPGALKTGADGRKLSVIELP